MVVADSVGVIDTLIDGDRPGVRLEEMAGKGVGHGTLVIAAFMSPIPA